MSTLEIINKEISTEISKPEIATQLLTTTFKGLTVPVMKQALLEGMTRGFKFEDFLKKNVYAIPYASGYSLVTSVDYARKVGMRSGVVGVSAPTYTELNVEGKDVKILESCTITVKRKVEGTIGEYTATVFYNEYYKAGKNGYPSLWDSKPKTMLAKVAEMHALRKACPEELAQSYVEEELAKEIKEVPNVDIDSFKSKLEATTNLDELKTVWANTPIEAKQSLNALKEELKKKYEDTKVSK